MKTMKKQCRMVISAILMILLCLLISPSYTGMAKTSGSIVESYEYTDQEQGVVYSLKSNNTCIVTKGKNKSKKITIPKEIKVAGKKYKVTEIGYKAFRKCSKLESIKIPEGVKAIKDDAFQDCSSLQGKIVIPKSVEELGDGVFSGCSKLEGLSVEKGNEVYSSDKYGNIYDNEKIILLYGSPYANSVKISKVKEIGYSAFQKCSKLESVKIPEGVIQIGDYAFSKCSNLKSINIPKTVTKIGDYALRDCSSLQEKIVIPKSVIVLGDRPFFGCSKLKGLSVEEGNRIYSSDKYGNIYDKEKTTLLFGTPCESSVSIPEGVKKIEIKAFLNCSKLKELTLPNSVVEIKRKAFFGCSNLQGKVIIPKSVKTLGDSVFYGCTNLEGLFVEEENMNYSSDESGNIYNKSKKCLIYGSPYASSIDIPEGVEEIGKDAFSKYKKLSNVTIPKEVEKIGEYAFFQCSNLSNIKISKGVKIIGEDAFFACSKLSDVDIPEGVEKIGESAFEDCSQLKSVSISGKIIGMRAFADCSKLSKVNMKKGVQQIGNYAFSKCSKLSNVDIPEGVEEIGEYAFEDCSSLKGKIVIPESMKVLERGLFAGCNKLEGLSVAKNNKVYSSDKYGNIYNKEKTKLTHGSPYAKEVVILKGTKVISQCAYEKNSNLKSIKLPKGLTMIDGNAFKNCDKLKSVNIPEGVKTIETYAFSGCAGLDGKVVIPKSVQFIDADAFQGCVGLKGLSVAKGNKTYSSDTYGNIYNISNKKKIKLVEGSPYAVNVSIAKGVKQIDAGSFNFCTKLKSVKLPEGVTKIGGFAFYGCRNLSNVYIPHSVKSIGEEAFIDCKDNLIFHVRKGSYGERYVKGIWRYTYKW